MNDTHVKTQQSAKT